MTDFSHISESIGNPLKSIDHGLQGTHYIEYIRLVFQPYRSYFYDALDYDLAGLVHLTNEEQVVKLLEAYFRHEHIYGRDPLMNHIERVIDDYLMDYLASVSSNVRRLYGKREFIEYDDIRPHAQDWAISELHNPDIADYYIDHQNNIKQDIEQEFIDNEWEAFVTNVVDWFMVKIEENIQNRTEVIWEVPHSLYKSTTPIDDSDIISRAIQPIAVLSKYESEYKDYDIEFNRRYFYKIVEHLPAGDVILRAKWEAHWGEDDRDGWSTTAQGTDIPYEGKNLEFYVPYPYIRSSPWCRRRDVVGIRYFEARFNNTVPEGGNTYACGPFYGNPPPRPHIVHPIRVRGSGSHINASEDVRTLQTDVERSTDLRDFEPPRIVATDEWYTTEHFGEYPSNESRTQETWWDEYRAANITTKEEWHAYWQGKMLQDKEDLVWYINTYIQNRAN